MDSFSSSDRTHRHSSSSSKPSIRSPARPLDPPPITLSTCRSRKLRTSGSIRNGLASPMFPAGGRKRGAGFENPEPSSPKVTCIGQVRVKSKKKAKKKTQTLTRMRRGNAEVSFRRMNNDQIQRQSSVNNSQYQQRWVHLPLTICETLRGFGSEFNCFFPCKPSCFSESSGREKVDEKEGDNEGGQSPCGGDMFRRWLVTVQDDSVSRDVEEGGSPMWGGGGRRRHVFDEIEIKDDVFQVNDCDGTNNNNNNEIEEGRVSVCIPPKNALLLMRCRSDPLKMEALANRCCWEPQLPKQEEGEEEISDNVEDNNTNDNKGRQETASVVEMVQVEDEEEVGIVAEKDSSLDQVLEEEEKQAEVEESTDIQLQYNKEEELIDALQNNEAIQDQEKQVEMEEIESLEAEEEDDGLGISILFEEDVGDEDSEEEDENENAEQEKEENRVSYSNASFSLQSDDETLSEDEEELTEAVAFELQNSIISSLQKEAENKRRMHAHAVVEKGENLSSSSLITSSLITSSSSKQQVPHSLMLMMYEPKLSMDVFKETWVSTTDIFIKWKPTTNGADESINNNAESSYNVQPQRSSCCLPSTMATMIGEKLVSAVAYEPFVLTRCKSAPLRKKLAASDACFWKNRTLEPHRRATFGIGAAEIGF